jgi:hypothetical protein
LNLASSALSGFKEAQEDAMVNALRRRWGLAIWLVIGAAVAAWGVMQPRTTLEPVPWVGTLDI